MKFILATLLFLLPFSLYAAEGITITPAKLEVQLKPGEQVVKNISISNQTDSALNFTTETKDFVGGNDAENPITFLATSTLLSSSDQQFTLAPGETRAVAVTIAIPADATAGGRYGAVFFNAGSNGGGNVNVSTGLAALFFVRIDGPVFQQAVLREFGFVNPNAQILFENQGDIYLNPYGFVSVTNLWGQEVTWQEIEPYFVMPHALRLQTVELKPTLGVGYYRVKLALNRGYDNVIDERVVTKIVWPKHLTLIIIAIIALAALLRHNISYR